MSCVLKDELIQQLRHCNHNLVEVGPGLASIAALKHGATGAVVYTRDGQGAWTRDLAKSNGVLERVQVVEGNPLVGPIFQAQTLIFHPRSPLGFDDPEIVKVEWARERHLKSDGQALPAKLSLRLGLVEAGPWNEPSSKLEALALDFTTWNRYLSNRPIPKAELSREPELHEILRLELGSDPLRQFVGKAKLRTGPNTGALLLEAQCSAWNTERLLLPLQNVLELPVETQLSITIVGNHTNEGFVWSWKGTHQGQTLFSQCSLFDSPTKLALHSGYLGYA